jgi:hypothetical protein
MDKYYKESSTARVNFITVYIYKNINKCKQLILLVFTYVYVIILMKKVDNIL